MKDGGREAKQGMPPLTFGSLELVLEMGMVVVRMVLDRGDDDNEKKKLWVHGLLYCRSARLGVQCRVLMSCLLWGHA